MMAIRSRLLSYFRGRADYLDARVFEDSMQARGLGHAMRIPSWTSPRELRTLHDLAVALPPNAAVLEIGSYLGASTGYLGAGLVDGGGRLYCVDTWQNETMPDGQRDTYSAFVANTRPLAGRLTAIRKRSDRLLDGDVPGPIHLAFIDGDHDYASVRVDLETVAQRLAVDGLIAFHDFGVREHPGVARVVGEALASGQWVQRGLVESLVWIARSAP